MIRSCDQYELRSIFCFFYKIKVNHFLYRLIILLNLILISSFSLTRFLFIPYAYVSIKSIDCILLSSFELKGILLVSSVKQFYLSMLSFCRFFNIGLLFLIFIYLFTYLFCDYVPFFSRYFISLLS